MIREFCDRCGSEVTGEQTGAIAGIADADRDGNGTVTDSHDIVCGDCYRVWKLFMKPEQRTETPAS